MQTNSNRESNRRTRTRQGWDAEAQAKRKQAKQAKKARRQRERLNGEVAGRERLTWPEG